MLPHVTGFTNLRDQGRGFPDSRPRARHYARVAGVLAEAGVRS